ncbi:MAG: hypothetical protein JWP37_1879 [Mucilaginibacter sp.]|nr:hypothetical protein [Mucilaginibacter sp.]
MRTYINLKVVLTICVSLLYASLLSAQKKNKKAPTHKSYADSLMGAFRNSVYGRIYNPAFWSKSYMPTLTILKISINKNGKVTDIRFSDSADTLFVKTFANMPKRNDDLSTLEKYALAKSYKDISILIPINYEPNYRAHRSFDYNNLQLLMRFDKKEFEGKALISPPLLVGVVADGGS